MNDTTAPRLLSADLRRRLRPPSPEEIAAIEAGRPTITVLEWSARCAYCNHDQAVTWRTGAEVPGQDLFRSCGDCGNGYGVSHDALTADDTESRPRLMYWEEAEAAWCLAGDELEGYVCVENLEPGEVEEIRVKRIDMTDRELAGLPQT